jgi:hypothetical protein
MRMLLKMIPVCVCLAASPALCQQLEGGWTINVLNTVSPAQPVAQIEVWAWFQPPGGGLVFGMGDFDLASGDGRLERPELARGFFGQPGTPAGSLLTGVLLGQVRLPGVFVLNGDNPIHVWSVSWETTDFTPRTVSLDTTNTTQFNLVEGTTGHLFPLYPQGFTPGTGTIQVVPTPASAVPMVVVGALMLRRRR